MVSGNNLTVRKQSDSCYMLLCVVTVQVEDIGPKIRAYNAPAFQTRTRLRL